MKRAHPVALLGVAVASGALAACDEVEDQSLAPPEPQMLEVVALGPDPGCAICPTVPLRDGSGTRCVCSIGGITMPVPPSPAPPPPWVFPPPQPWPLPPGYPAGGGGVPQPDADSPTCEEFNDREDLPASCYAEKWTASLSCPTTVQRSATGTCRLTVEPAGLLDRVIEWSFKGRTYTRRFPENTTSWGGKFIQSGRMKVVYVVGGAPPAISTADIKVTDRNWQFWQNGVGGRRAKWGEIDRCIAGAASTLSTPLWGMTSGKDCTYAEPEDLFSPRVARFAQGRGFELRPVRDGGPSNNKWYVWTTSADMALRAQVNREYRNDGPSHQMHGSPSLVAICNNQGGNVAEINFGCGRLAVENNQFGAFRSFVWSHEQSHIPAGLRAARRAPGDVHYLLESATANSESRLAEVVKSRYRQAHMYVSIGLDNHTGDASFFRFWRYGSNGWFYKRNSVAH